MTEQADLTPLPAKVRELLEKERQRGGPPPESRARMYGRLAAALGFGLGLGGPSDPGGSAGSSPTGAPPPLPDPAPAIPSVGTSAVGAAATAGGLPHVVAAFLKPAVAVAFAVGAIAGAGTTYVMHRSPVASGVETRGAGERGGAGEPSAGSSLKLIPIQVRVPAEPSASQPHAATPASRPRRPAIKLDPGALRDSLAAERALVERARTAMARSRAADALAALRQHRKKFPAGQLAEEREALTVIVLASLGENDQASEIAARFRKKYPQSLLMPAVNAALEENRPGQTGDREKPKHLP